MKEYKRFTGKITIGNQTGNILECSNCVKKETCKNEVNYRNTCLRVAIDRLAELEDKLENGTLIELPCKVGDKFYQVVKGLPIHEWEVETIVFGNIYSPKNYVMTARRTKDLAFWKFWSEDIGETIFLTKAEGEAKLRELQGDK